MLYIIKLQYLASCISLFRAIMGFYVPYLFNAVSSKGYFAKVLLILSIIITQFSDGVDGIVARKLGSVAWGHFIDSGADRMFAIGMLLSLCSISGTTKHIKTLVFCVLLEVIDFVMLWLQAIPIQYHQVLGYNVHFTKFTFGICQGTVLIASIICLFKKQYINLVPRLILIVYILKGLSLMYYFVGKFGL